MEVQRYCTLTQLRDGKTILILLGDHMYHFLPFIFLDGNNPLAQAFCSSGGIPDLGWIKLRVGCVRAPDLSDDWLGNAILYEL